MAASWPKMEKFIATGYFSQLAKQLYSYILNLLHVYLYIVQNKVIDIQMEPAFYSTLTNSLFQPVPRSLSIHSFISYFNFNGDKRKWAADE